MSAYVILIGTEEKNGVLEPDIIGPFADADAANAWLEGDIETGWYGPCNSRVAAWFDTEADMHGGYPAIHVVSDATATDPEQWGDFYDEAEDDDTFFETIAQQTATTVKAKLKYGIPLGISSDIPEIKQRVAELLQADQETS
jgi:hypothetical protein